MLKKLITPRQHGAGNPLSRGLRTRPAGSALIESVFVLFILLYLTFGTVEYGHFFYWKHTLQGAAREGARTAITPTADNNSVTSAVAGAMNAAGVKPAQYVVHIRNVTDTADLNVATASPGTPVLVKVTSVWGQVGVRPMGLITPTKQVVGQTVMRKE